MKNRTDGGGADKEQEELKRKIAALENILEENNRQIRQQNETIKKMKERRRSEIQYIRTKEEIEKRSLLQKIRHMRDEIISLEERRPPKAKGRSRPPSKRVWDLAGATFSKRRRKLRRIPCRQK
jgi:septal ring factor EnvC (AmiA/AmiB activator)